MKIIKKWYSINLFLLILVARCTPLLPAQNTQEESTNIATVQAPDNHANWTVLIFIEGRNNLNSFAMQNLNDMALVGSSEKLNILVQWYQEGKMPWRYIVEKNNIKSIGGIANARCDCQNELVDAMRWAVDSYPAKHYALILWDHGLGVTDPVWYPDQSAWGLGANLVPNKEKFETQAGTIAEPKNPRTHITGITVPAENQQRHMCSHRGILFNEVDRTYLSNQDMFKAFTRIKDEILGGRKIDLVGMDACLMAMLEIGYQIKDCADFFVGSEEVELADGWQYGLFLAALSHDEATPKYAARAAVKAYENYYRSRSDLYTLSAIDLSYIDCIRFNLDEIIKQIYAYMKHDKIRTRKIIGVARRRCQQYSTPTFVDLHSFYTEMLGQLEYQSVNIFFEKKKTENTSTNTDDSKEVLGKLENLLKNGIKLIEQVVLANTAGPYLTRSMGISLYFPCSRIDASYVKTQFAEDSLWATFLQDLLRHD